MDIPITWIMDDRCNINVHNTRQLLWLIEVYDLISHTTEYSHCVPSYLDPFSRAGDKISVCVNVG